MKSPISNDCLKAIFDYQTEPKMFPKLLLQVSVKEHQNILVGDPNDGGLKEEGNEENNIIISDFTLRMLLLPQLKQCQNDTRSCVVVNVTFLLRLYIRHCYPGVIGTEPQLVPKLLLQVSVRKMHNSLISDPTDGGLKDARDEDDNIIISDSILSLLLPSQLKQIPERYKVMCGCECYISAKIG